MGKQYQRHPARRTKAGRNTKKTTSNAEEFKLRKEIIRTQYSAAEAQVKIKERVTLPQKK
ncbi:MAG TPA: hypothetical protein VE199_00575 [Nitrososphaera sp.]|nr:hypothetical protein [Nitrososphaera sp.]